MLPNILSFKLEMGLYTRKYIADFIFLEGGLSQGGCHTVFDGIWNV